jgi:hypothetical protein
MRPQTGFSINIKSHNDRFSEVPYIHIFILQTKEGDEWREMGALA